MLDHLNGIGVLLSTINCDLANKFIFRKNHPPELECFGDPLYYKNENAPKPCTWRNLFTVISIIKILKKLEHQNASRERTLIKSKVLLICKRSLMPISHPDVELYTLKIVKPLVKYLNNEWRKNNGSLISKIALKVPQDIIDEWLMFIDSSQTSRVAEVGKSYFIISLS